MTMERQNESNNGRADYYRMSILLNADSELGELGKDYDVTEVDGARRAYVNSVEGLRVAFCEYAVSPSKAASEDIDLTSQECTAAIKDLMDAALQPSKANLGRCVVAAAPILAEAINDQTMFLNSQVNCADYLDSVDFRAVQDDIVQLILEFDIDNYDQLLPAMTDLYADKLESDLALSKPVFKAEVAES